ncbi:putative homeobox-leucine zipper protein ATHB-40-like [Capsicum annuum]|nr:putative homeobox-leucine zipper protein ATHB-40-like [Capsicum annuum]
MEENGIMVRNYGDVSSDVVLLASNQLISSSSTKGFEENPKIDVGNATNTGNSSSHAVEFVNDLIWVDPGACCFALYSKLSVDKVLPQQSPLALPKALKNPVEIEGLKKAHIRDGAAVVQYLVWLDKQVSQILRADLLMQELYGASGYFMEAESTKEKKQLGTRRLTEVSVSDKLEEFRASKEHFRGLSFRTTSSVGSNAAIIHYKPEAETCAELDPDCIYLFDSGAQVLKGHISLGNARFPNGINGHALDALARIPLWKYGLDYKHGTGHRIGSYLNVHEGPHQISLRPSARDLPLQVSMAVTDEPGYYEDRNFGIRIENVLIVKECNTKFNFGDKGYLSFEHITWAPYQRKLIDVSVLVPEEVEWLNEYHAKCREILAPYLNTSEMEWLKKATEPIAA